MIKVLRVLRVPGWVPLLIPVLVAAVLVLGAAQASAQTPTPAPAPAPASTMIVEKIESGWLVSPEVRVADLDGRAGTLAGGYVGRVTDWTLVFGAGGYWLTNRHDDFKMAYGGAVVEWLARSDRTIGFGVRTLVGGGTATLPVALGDIVQIDPRRQQANARGVRFGGTAINPATRVAVRDDFLVLEPQLNLLWNLTTRYRMSFGVGYRVIGSAPWLGDQLEGVSGSVAFRIGGGS